MAKFLRFFEPRTLSPSGFAARGDGRQAETDRLKATFHKPAGFAPHHPAPGCRHSSSGDPVHVGYYGYSWSSASYDSGDHCLGMYLDFCTQYLSPSNAGYRAFGFQLRCLSE